MSSTPDFLSEWMRCLPMLKPAMDRAPMYIEQDYREMCQSGAMMFWPGVKSALVTQIVRYPRAKALRAVLAGGELEEIRDVIEPVVSRWARESQGCTLVEIIGRPGWERALPAYERQAVYLTRSM